MACRRCQTSWHVLCFYQLGLWLQPDRRNFWDLGGDSRAGGRAALFWGRNPEFDYGESVSRHGIPERIRDRLGEKRTERRLFLQEQLVRKKLAQGLGPFAFERFFSVNACISATISALGLSKRGLLNALDLRIEEHEVVIPNLPASFEGFRVLQLADLHCDLDPRIMERITEGIVSTPHDAVVLTGDYHNDIRKPFDRSIAEMLKLIPTLHPIRFAVLGNHDFLEKVAPLEEAGLPILLNESASIEREGKRLWICGIDDPYFFRTHDLSKPRLAIPAGEPSIFLSHSPETYREASVLGYDLHLSGHTHGGQVCAPGGFPLYRNAPGCRREHLAGSWSEGRMIGYTSRGTGSAGVAARFHCPPEITVHILTSHSQTNA